MAKIVHIYNKKLQKVDSIYVPSFESFKEEPIKFFENWKKDYIASAIELQNPVFKDGELREATREELVEQGIEISLEEGEKIENKKIIKIEKPSEYHKWDGENWVINLQEVKLAKREELKTIRNNSVYQPLKIDLIPYGEKKKVEVEFKVEEIDLAKFSRIKGILLTLNELGVTKEDIKGSKTILQNLGIDKTTVEVIIQFLNTGAIPWVLADNTSKMFDFKELGMVQVAFGIREQQIFGKFIHLDSLLTRAKTVEEIEAIKWK